MITEIPVSKVSPSKPFFSIVVPTWNRGAIIEETMHSLLDQDFPHSQYEIIIVDDGSTDDTLERLQSFSSRIRVLRQPKSGTAAARNLGIQNANGDYIASFDSDDILSPYALSVYKTVIDAFDRPPVVLAQHTSFRGGQAVNLYPAKPSMISCIRCRDYFGKAVRSSTFNINFVLRKDVVLGVGGYSFDSFDDADLIFKLGTASPMVKIVQPITTAVRLHDGNVTKDLTFFTRGVKMHIRSERRGVYPGGWRRMLDRRGLIGVKVLSSLYSYYIPARHVALSSRLAHIARLLLYARGMILAAVVRKCCSYFYFQESRLLASDSGYGRDRGTAVTVAKERTDHEHGLGA